MPHYRCYFVEKGGGPTAWRYIESDSDGEANDHALGLLVGYPRADKVEVWNDLQQILSYSRSAVQTAAELRRLYSLAIGAAKKETDPKIKSILSSCAAVLAQEAESLEPRAT